MSAPAISQTVTFFLCFLQINSVQENLELNMDSFDRKFFIQYLFTKYGNRTIMTYEGFEHLMNGIELGNIILDDTIDAHHKLNSTDFQTLHGTNHSHVIDTSEQTTRRRRHAKHEVHDTDQSNDLLKTCLSPSQLLQFYSIERHDVITRHDFSQLCPALIFQLDNRRCLKTDVLILYKHFKIPETMGNKAWGYGFVCILIISVCGLLVVATVPLLQRISFDGILQFLVALAVGALTGDAMLHLIPHALAPHTETSHDHDPNGQEHEHVFKGLCGLGAMYFFFLIGRIQTIIASKRKKNNNTIQVDTIPEYKEKLNTEDFETEFQVGVHHSIGHTHTHELPASISGMVWRVIVGDGIHNFSDGLAIGVAFANSITGGISTSIAVLCHELPHEMGDFAMLLKKGVSIKRAVLFNCLSSVLSCVGMTIGIGVGNIGAASLWIFVGVAGMFIYISLVDMIPELTALSDEEEHPWRKLLSQICGIMVGTGIMISIALYEEQMKTILD